MTAEPPVRELDPRQSRHRKRGIAIAAVATVVAGLVTVRAIKLHPEADFTGHLAMAKVALAGGSFPGDFLFYVLDACIAGFRPIDSRLLVGLVLQVAVAGGIKAFLTVRFAEDEYRAVTDTELPARGALLAALCTLAFGLPIGLQYPQFIPPNVWHNSTTAVVMPLAIGLYLVSLAYLRTPATRLLWLTTLLLALNIATKPSFVFCWLVVFPVAVFLRDRRRAALVGPTLVCMAGGGMLTAQYVYIYILERGALVSTRTEVAIAPFHVWSKLTPNIPMSILAGYAFPIVALLLAGPRIRHSLPVRYALGLAAVGLVLFALLTETGFRQYHGNFGWQAIITNYLLFLAVMSAVLPWLRETRIGWRQAIVLAVFALQVFNGCIYLAEWLA
jgi:hypothetical protein